MEDLSPESSHLLSILHCDENLFAEDEQEVNNYQEGIGIADDDEYAQELLQREIDFPRFDGFDDHSSYLMDNRVIVESRATAIDWILNTSKWYRYQIQTAYRSVTYFDRLLSEQAFGAGNPVLVRVVSLLCLLLAAKMEETMVPSLSGLLMERGMTVRFLKQTEITMLRLLQWRLSSITPFCYISYFLSKFSNERLQRSLIERISELIMSTVRDMNLMTHRPSAIAIAATLIALDQDISKQALECKLNALYLNGLPPIDDVFYCYDEMQELERVRIRQGSTNNQSLPGTRVRGRDGILKRRRLDFDDLR